MVHLLAVNESWARTKIRELANDPAGQRSFIAGIANSTNYTTEQRTAAQAWLRSHHG